MLMIIWYAFLFMFFCAGIGFIGRWFNSVIDALKGKHMDK